MEMDLNLYLVVMMEIMKTETDAVETARLNRATCAKVDHQTQKIHA